MRENHPTPRSSAVRLRRCVTLMLAPVLICAHAADRSTTLPSPTALKKLTVDQLMDLDVTSVSKRPEKLFEAASAVQVVTAEDVRRSGARNLPEALRLASNLEVAQIDARQWAITARGFNNVFADKMLVLIDGRSVYTPLFAGVYWDVQDTLLADLDRIEVISGPGATQWGANAVNGVINITTKSAKDTQGGFLLGGGGTEHRAHTAFRYGGQAAPGVYYRVYGKVSDHDASVRSSGVTASDGWHLAQGGFRTDWESSTTSSFTLQGDAYTGHFRQPGPDDVRVNGLNTLGRWTYRPSPTSDLKLQLYFDHTHRRNPGSFNQDLNTGDIDFQHHLAPSPDHDVVWGFGYRVVADDIDNTPNNAFLPPRVSRSWLNVFAQDEIILSKDRLAVTVGTKLEHNGYTGFEWEPSARLAWTPDRQHTVWGAVSRAVRTPSRIDRDLYSPATPPYRMAGGSHVVSEKLIAFELGWRHQLTAGFTLSLATFYNAYDDLRSLEPLNPPARFPVEASTGLEGHSSGTELTADWRIAPTWRLRAGYTELRVHSEPQPGSLDRATRGSIARDPNHQFHLRSLWDISTTWECDVDLRYVSSIGIHSVPGYTEACVRLGWTPAPRWEISVTGQNLLHSRHSEFYPPGSRRAIERGVHAQVSWRY